MGENKLDIPNRVVIFADSQALPRRGFWGSPIPADSTYPWRLHDRFRKRLGERAPLVTERGLRARTVLDILSEWHEEVTLKQPDVVVIHVGGSDCAPRLLPRRTRLFLERCPGGSALLSLEEKARRLVLSRSRGLTYVSPARFREALAKMALWARRDGVRKLVLVNIIATSPKLEFMSPGAKRNTLAYNAIFSELAEWPGIFLVDFHSLVTRWGGPDLVTVDTMHLKPEFQEKLAEVLEDTILSGHSQMEATCHQTTSPARTSRTSSSTRQRESCAT